MAEPFIAEIRIMSFDFAPRGWALCNGQLLPINQNQGLFSLLGTTYGGDGRVNFALPDLRGRTPIHIGNGHNFGEKGGEQAHTLTIAELPTHTHTLAGTSSAANSNNATNAMLGAVNNSYGAVQNLVALSSATLINTGGGQAHLNMQPFSTVNFSIALQGIFPSRN